MGRERRGIRDERRSGNPSAGLSGEEGVMTGRSYGPQGGEGWREVGHLSERDRKREEVSQMIGERGGTRTGMMVSILW